ncbi:MAG: S8 family serine peptidase [Candidatus Eisenbacteria bacterium]
MKARTIASASSRSERETCELARFVNDHTVLQSTADFRDRGAGNERNHRWFVRVFVAISIALLPLFGPTASAVAQSQGQASGDAAFVPNEVLVRFAPEASFAERSQVVSLQQATVVKESSQLGYSKLRLTGDIGVEEAITRLSMDPAVVWAEPNGFYEADAATPQDPMLVDLPGTPENQWGIFKTGVFDLWRYGSGAGPIIAIVDTGINSFGTPHPDLAANVLATGIDYVGDDTNPTDEGAGAPGYGHGTHVAGIAAAESNDLGIAGVDFQAKLLFVRVLDCTAGGQCPGTYEDIADGIQWAADHDADVINLSLGGPDASNTVRAAVQYAIQAGAIVVAAAGNDGAPVLSYPAGFPETIAVGATDANDDVASFSNWGPELDVVAPGVDIYSTIPGPSFGKKSGTSMATPFVSGLAALITAKNPAITQSEMETYLQQHALPLAGANAERDGSGRVNFMPLQDWSDAEPPYPPASHGNFAWEWLGDEASPEPTIDDPMDGDFVPNIGPPGVADGYDDGVFPPSILDLPFLPEHLDFGGNGLDVIMSVSGFDGPRYDASPAKSLHLDVGPTGT